MGEVTRLAKIQAKMKISAYVGPKESIGPVHENVEEVARCAR